MAEHLAYIGIGSNLNDPLTQVCKAVEQLEQEPSTMALELSPLYTSTAVGPGNQPDYINAVARLHTSLTPLALLDLLQKIETAQQRVRLERWGPRTIDLDILLYDQDCMSTARLTIPHPYMHERNFVIAPLYDLNPNLILPSGQSISNILTSLGTEGLRRHRESTTHE